MKILLVNPHKSFINYEACGGGERLLLSTFRALKERGYSVEIAIREGVIPNAIVHHPNNDEIQFDSYLKWIAIISEKFDLILLFELPEALPYITKPVVCWFMNERSSWIIKPIPKYSKMIFVTESHRNNYISDNNNKYLNNTTIIPPFIKRPLNIKRNYQSVSNHKRILCASMWHPKKGILEYLDTLLTFEKSGYSFSATLAGGTSLWGLKDDNHCFFPKESRNKFHEIIMQRASKIRSLNVVGKLSHKKLLQLFKNIDIFCLFSSFNEGLPISILEALSRGVAVIASNVGGVPDAVQHGKNGLLISSHLKSTSIKYLEKLLVDPNLCTQFQQNAPASILNFDESIVIDRLVDVFDESLNLFAAYK